MHLHQDIRYIGVDDHEIDLFEGQYIVPAGMAYNSYVILDEKVAVMDSVDRHFGDEWMANLTAALDGRAPDYLIVQHMEPDHSANITRFMEAYPQAQMVSNVKSFPILKKLYGTDYPDRQVAVKDGDTLSLGKHTLTFVAAPMVHWPEVIMTYDDVAKTFFSADGFGKFGALDADEDWACEARRYYFGIVGKFGVQVTRLLGKLGQFDIQTICPLHGPVLEENLDYYLGLYQTWASYGVESEGVCIAYTSVYGNTKAAVEQLAAKLTAAGCPKVAVTDLARDDMAEAVEDAFRYGKLVLATTTYNGGMFPFMHDFISHLADHAYQNRTIGLMENGLWAPAAARAMRTALEPLKNITLTETTVTLNGASDEAAQAQMDALVAELMA